MARDTRTARRTARRRGRGRGAVAAEFALVFPFFAMILFATTDIVRSFRAQLRAEMVAVQIGQIISQCERLTRKDFTDGNYGFWAHARRISGGVVDLNAGSMFVTAIGRDGNSNKVHWQQRTVPASFAIDLRGLMPTPEPLREDRATVPVLPEQAPLGTAFFAPSAPASDFTVGMANPRLRGQNGATFEVPTGQTLFVIEVFATIEPWILSGEFLQAVLGGNDGAVQIKSMSMFLSRSPAPSTLLQTPANNNRRECTA